MSRNIEVTTEDDFVTITELDTIEEITISKVISGEFEIEFDRAGDIKTYVLSRKQMIEVRDWINGALR